MRNKIQLAFSRSFHSQNQGNHKNKTKQKLPVSFGSPFKWIPLVQFRLPCFSLLSEFYIHWEGAEVQGHPPLVGKLVATWAIWEPVTGSQPFSTGSQPFSTGSQPFSSSCRVLRNVTLLHRKTNGSRDHVLEIHVVRHRLPRRTVFSLILLET